MISDERIQVLRKGEVQNRDYVLYWMQASQRAWYNHALEYAIDQANKRSKPLVVFFGLTDYFLDANERHYAFMLQGLKEVYYDLQNRKIAFIVQNILPEKGALKLSKRADLVVTDRGYLNIQRVWRHNVAAEIDCPFMQIESDVIVPVETVYPKSAFGAYVLRPKIHQKIIHFQCPLYHRTVQHPIIHLDVDTICPINWKKTLNTLQVDRTVKASPNFIGGYSQAIHLLEAFIQNKLDYFHLKRNDPSMDMLSHLSPYLHFGQISSLEIVLKIDPIKSPGKEAFFEELIIRRELSMNFVFYDADYDNFNSLPQWAKQSLTDHAGDPREFVYTREQFEHAETHDPYWNAAQKEMILTGKMHGYMRMYWGKKILEWSHSPQSAYETAIYLNNKYELDGRDPNGFAGISWCFGKHDRAWGERPVYGKVRSMNAKGLERKFDIQKYIQKINQIENV